MNKIEEKIQILKNKGIEKSVIKKGKEQLIKEVVEKKDLKSLVNIININKNIHDIHNEYNNYDFHISSFFREFNGKKFKNEKEYMSYITNNLCISYIDIKKDVFLIYPTVEYPYKKELCISQYIHTKNKSEKKISNNLLDYIRKNILKFFKKFEDLQEEDLEELYDLIDYSIIINFNQYVDKENARKSGLGILHHNKQDENYMFLIGNTTDKNFRYAKYLAYTYKAISKEYLNSLEIIKLHSTNEEWKEILNCLIPEEYKQYITLFL